MKKLAAIAMAGALATATVASTAETANATTPLGWFLIGGVVGFGVATIIYHQHPFGTFGYATYGYAGDSHTAWCQAHYRSYVAATDTFTGYDGRTYRCAAPY